MSLKNMRISSRSQQIDRSLLILQDSRCSSAYSLGQFPLSANVKEEEANDASGFGTDIVSFKHIERTSSVDLYSVDGLDLEWNKARERDGKLNYTLSRMQMEYEKTKILFLETQEFAEVLKKENRVLKEKLGNESNLVSHLRQQLMLTEGNNEVLAEEVEDLKTEMDNMARERVKLSESIVLANAKISKQEKLLNRLEDWRINNRHSYDLNISKTINELVNELEQERACRKQIACRLWDTETRLEEAEKLKNQLMKEYEELKAKFEKSSNSLSNEFIHTYKEKKLLELSHERVSQVFITSEVGSDVAYEKISRNIHFRNDEDPLYYPSLAQQLYSNSDCESLSNESELIMLESDVHRDTVNANNDTMNEINPVQTYLYNTATAVKLHFPELKIIVIDRLIEHVKESPFYLWYYLMMGFVQELIQKEGIKQPDNVDSLPQSCKELGTLMARFKRLLHGDRGSSRNKSITFQADSQYRWSKYPALFRGCSTTISL